MSDGEGAGPSWNDSIGEKATGHDDYPGELATPEQVLRLAEEYRKAARLLLELGRRGDPLSRAPWRFCAIHSIELHLNALLRHAGHDPSRIRGMRHDLSARTALATSSGIHLKKQTKAHLSAMVGNREYLVARYGPEMPTSTSEINRLTATLNEVAGKVIAMMKAPQRLTKSPSEHVAGPLAAAPRDAQLPSRDS